MPNCTPQIETVVDGNGTTQSFPVPPQNLMPVTISAASVFPLTLQAATAGQLTRLYRLFLVSTADCVVTFYDGATALAPALTLTAGVPLELDAGLFPWFQGSVNTDFKMNILSAGTLTGAAYVNLNPT